MTNPLRWLSDQVATRMQAAAKIQDDERETRKVMNDIRAVIADGETHLTSDFSLFGDIGNMWTALGRLEAVGDIECVWVTDEDMVTRRMWRRT